MALYTVFYPTFLNYAEFYTETTTITWRGGWDQVAVKTSLGNPSINPPPPTSPSGTAFPVMNLCHAQRGEIVRTVTVTSTQATTHTTALYRAVTAPLAAQTISGTMDVIFAAFGTTAGRVASRVYVAVLEGDTDVVRGVLGTTEDPDTHRWLGTGSATGAALDAPMTLTPLAIQEGDRLLLEFGCIERPAGSTSITRSLRLGQVSNQVIQTLIAQGESLFGTRRAPSVLFSTPIEVLDLTLDTGDVIVGNIDIFHYRSDGTLKGVTISVGGGTGSGVGLPDGTLWTPGANQGALHWGPTMELLETVGQADADDHEPHVIRAVRGDTSGTVYIGNPNAPGPCESQQSATIFPTGYIQKVVAGAVVQSWTPAGEYSGIPSFDFAPDGDTIYYTSLGPTIKAYRLSDSTQLPDFLALPPLTHTGFGGVSDGTFFRGVRCLSDGTVLACRVTFVAGVQTASDITHYDTDGTTLHTYTLSGAIDWGTLSPTNDETAFWASDTGDGRGSLGPVTMARFNIATEAVEVTVTGDTNIMQTGAGGHLCSGGQCVVPVLSGPPFPVGTLVVQKVTAPSTDATLFDFTTGGGLAPSTFSLAHGESITYTDLPAGSGYAVAETPNANYTTTYLVSNGSPISNLLIEDGQTTTVTVTNTRITGSIRVTKSTSAPGAALTFEFTANGLDPIFFTLSDGEEQIFDPVLAGSGYAITEILNALYAAGYAVSNGSLHTNLTVVAGEETLVAITNTYTGTGTPTPGCPTDFPV